MTKKGFFAGSVTSNVTLFAFTPVVKSLTWLNPYTKDTMPDVYPQTVSKHGTKQYIVKLPYAQRLLARQPHMYHLSEPDSIDVRRPNSQGGFDDVKVTRKVEKLDKDGKVVIAPRDFVKGTSFNKKGYPILIDPEEDDNAEL